MPTNDERLAKIYIDIEGRTQKLEKQLRQLKTKVGKDADIIRNKFETSFNKWSNNLGKRKINELIVLQKRLQMQMRKKISMNVSGRSLDLTRRKLQAVEGQLQGVGKQAQKQAGIFKNAWLAAAAKITIVWYAIRRAISLSKEFKNAARDAEETENKFKTVFENIQDEAISTAKVFARSYKLADSTAQKLFSTTGDLLVGFGFTEKAALDMSRQVNELAVDLASFSNFEGGAERASMALTKGLLGERESMKLLGISVNENTEIFKRLVKEQIKTKGASLIQAKALATLKIAVDQSKKSIGDFSRTHKQLANQERIASEEAKKLKEKIGKKLAPTFLSATKLAINFFRALTETDLEKTIRQLSELGTETRILTQLTASNTLLRNLEEERKLRKEIQSIRVKEEVLNIRVAPGIKQEDFLKIIKQLEEGQFDAAQKQELLKNKTLELKDALLELAKIQEKGLKAPKLESRVNALKYELEIYSNIISRQEAINQLRKDNEIAKKIIAGEKIESKASEEETEVIKQNIKERDELIKQFYSDLKWEASGYHQYRLKMIEDEYQDMKKFASKEINVEQWKNEQIKRLQEERNQYYLKGRKFEAKLTPEKKESWELEKLPEGYKPPKISEEYDSYADLVSGFSDSFHEAFMEVSDGWSDLMDDWLGESKNIFQQMAKSFLSAMGSALTEVAARWAMMQIFKFIGLPIPIGHSGGTFQNGKKIAPYMGAQMGASFTVPKGFPNDSFPMMVESGEKVSVTPAASAGNETRLLKSINNSIQAMNMNMVGLGSRQDRIEQTLSIGNDALRATVKKSQDQRSLYQGA